MTVAIDIDNTWPATIPLPFIDYTGSESVTTVVSPKTSARIQRRSRWSTPYASVSVTWRLDPDQYAAFLAFWGTALGDGTAKFSIELKYPKISALDIWIARFIGNIEIANIEDRIYEVSAALQITTKAVVDDAAATLFDPTLISGLQVWLDASQETHTDLDTNVGFTDQSGFGRNYTATTGITYRTGITPKGTAVMRYSGGTGHQSSFNLAALSWTQGEIFLMVSGHTTTSGIMAMGNSGSADLYPFSDADVYSDAFSNVRYSFTPSIGAVNTFNVLNIDARNGAWNARINGVVEHALGSNTFQIPTTTMFGNSFGSVNMTGDIAEVLIFGNVLSAIDRAAIRAYLQSKHT